MPLFRSGTIRITPAASTALAAVDADSAIYLTRHKHGDWGEVDEDTRQDNDFAVEHNQTICSQYKLSDGTELRLVTPADRSSTTLSLATEYPLRKVSTQKGYALWASFYDQQKNALIAVEEPHVDAIIATLPITNALDVGTGTGRHALKLARHGAAVTAIDPSPDMLTVAKDNARKEGLTIDFRSASLDADLPFVAGMFDFIICALVLCHVPNLAHAMQEFARLLRPSGYLLITDFHPDAISEYGWRTEFTIADAKYLLPNLSHSRAGYIEALKRAAFTILDVIDVPLDELPDGYVPEEMMRESGKKKLCFIALCQKQT